MSRILPTQTRRFAAFDRLAAAFLVLAAAGALAAAGSAPAAVRVAPLRLELPGSAIDYTAGTVTVAADYPAGTSMVVFTADGQLLAAVEIPDAGSAGTVNSGVPVRLGSAVEFAAQALDSSGAIMSSATLGLSPSSFVPTTPTPALERGSLVEPSFQLDASSNPNRPVTSVTVTTGPEPLRHSPRLVAGANGGIVLSGVRVPYGVEWLKIVASNGFGSSQPSAKQAVFNLGWSSGLPKSPNYVLVDKRSMTLYDIRGRRVVSHYEIAVGTPSTPTPDGYFKIGSPRPSSGPWGPMRRPLFRFSGRRIWPTGFYIHGTDEPWSIGTWASHGCVRMQDWAIRRFSRTVPDGTLVRIRS